MKVRSMVMCAAAAALAVPVALPQTASAVTYGRYLGTVACGFGGSKAAYLDIYGDAIVTYRFSGVRYSTTPAFHAEKVQLMLKHTTGPYPPVFSTIATWGDGSTGSVATAFGSGQVSGMDFQRGDIVKIKVTETGRSDWTCSQLNL